MENMHTDCRVQKVNGFLDSPFSLDTHSSSLFLFTWKGSVCCGKIKQKGDSGDIL